MKKNLLLTYCLIILLMLLSLSTVDAAPSFRSKKLQKLATVLPLNTDSLHEGLNMQTINGRQIKVTVTGNQIMTIGYHLFTDELKAIAATPILTFLERYFLQIDYPETVRPRERMLREDRFKFEKGSRVTVASLRPDDAFSFNYELRRYVATWTRDDQPLLIVSFPAEHELISGENKIEGENNVEMDILSAIIPTGQKVSHEILTPTVQKNYFIKKGGTYLNDQLTSTLYYQQQGGAYHLLTDVFHPLESAANMMLSADAEYNCRLKVKQSMYGYKKKYFEVPLQKWIAYCKNNGCELYYGAESFNNNIIKASVIAVNNAENYNHVLFVNIPLTVIEKKEGLIEAQLETFIPMHNVRNIFAKYQKTKNKEKKLYE